MDGSAGVCIILSLLGFIAFVHIHACVWTSGWWHCARKPLTALLDPVGGGVQEFSDAHCPMHRGFNGHCTDGGGKFFNGGLVWERAK